MNKKKFNYYKFGGFCLVVLLIVLCIVFGIVSLINNIKYKKTIEYKLITQGYSQEEVGILENNISYNELNKLLEIKYDSNIDNFVSCKYFLFKNLNEYINYKKDNKNIEYDKIVSIVNSEANIEWLDNEKITDTSKNELILVNRIYKLDDNYEVGDIVDISSKYAYSGKKISSSIIENIIELIDEAKENGFIFVVSSGYRSNAEQQKIYNNYVDSIGINDADELVARPGHSEYETGLSFDLEPYNKVFEDAYESDEYVWLKNNAHKYGFILRFPKDKEDITQFKSSTWRLRYVGIDVAQIIYNEELTFEEYYAYYVVGE